MCLGVLTLRLMMNLLFVGTILSDMVLENLTIVFLLPLLFPLAFLENLTSPITLNLSLNLNHNIEFELDPDLFIVLELYLDKNRPWP